MPNGRDFATTSSSKGSIAAKNGGVWPRRRVVRFADFL
jgi:hypothetical protein